MGPGNFYGKTDAQAIFKEKIEDANKVLKDDDAMLFQAAVKIAVNSRSINKKGLTDALAKIRAIIDAAPDDFLFQPELMIQTVDSAGERMMKEQQDRLEARRKLMQPPAGNLTKEAAKAVKK